VTGAVKTDTANLKETTGKGERGMASQKSLRAMKARETSAKGVEDEMGRRKTV